MLNSLRADELNKVLQALVKNTKSQEIEWKPWTESSMDEEYVAESKTFAYYIGRENDIWDKQVSIRFEIWKLRAAADEKHLQIQETQVGKGEDKLMDTLFDLARAAALDIDDVSADILRDLGEA